MDMGGRLSNRLLSWIAPPCWDILHMYILCATAITGGAKKSLHTKITSPTTTTTTTTFPKTPTQPTMAPSETARAESSRTPSMHDQTTSPTVVCNLCRTPSLPSKETCGTASYYNATGPGRSQAKVRSVDEETHNSVVRFSPRDRVQTLRRSRPLPREHTVSRHETLNSFGAGRSGLCRSGCRVGGIADV